MDDTHEIAGELEDEKETADVDPKPNSGKGVIASVVPYDATSFADVEEFAKANEVRERVGELSRQFEALTHNILWTDDIDKVSAMKTLVKDFEAQLSEAIDLGGNTIWDAVKAVFRKPDPLPEPKTKNGLFIWKEGDRYRWFAVFSNKFRDDDNPPEILSEKSHINFVEMVDSGVAPYPELWHWHIPGSRWGQSDWVAYDDELGFQLASGYVDPGNHDEAKAIMELEEPLGVSHGLEVLERNSKDETIIESYVSIEISELPMEAAANKLTGFSLIEAEEDQVKGIPEEKREHLLSVGLTEDKISEIESDLEAKAGKANEAGLDFKENEPVADPEVDGTEKLPEAEATEEGKSEEVEIDDLTLPASRQEVLEAIQPVTEAIVGINETLEGLKATDEEKIKDAAEDTPAFSIAHLVRSDLSVIGKEATLTEEKDGPKENKSDEESITGVPWIDSMLVEEK